MKTQYSFNSFVLDETAKGMYEQIRIATKSMISVTENELDGFLDKSYIKNLKRKEILSQSETIPNNVYFINSGLIRTVIVDNKGIEHTTHFALENKFISNYSGFLQKERSLFTLQALEDTEVVVLPRSAIEWGYANMKEGDRLGRLIAESYFIYFHNRIKDMYCKSPKERYDVMSTIFPEIHNRVPQHMIASYIGITPIHLSRLKKEQRVKL